MAAALFVTHHRRNHLHFTISPPVLQLQRLQQINRPSGLILYTFEPPTQTQQRLTLVVAQPLNAGHKFVGPQQPYAGALLHNTVEGALQPAAAVARGGVWRLKWK